MELDKLILKFMWKNKKLKVVKIIFKKIIKNIE